jgi:tetratricopeptide (TPR) repeat protein
MTGVHEAWSRYAAHYLEVLHNLDNVYLTSDEDDSTLDAFNLEWENIRAGQAWAAAHMADDDEAANLCLYYPGAGTYLLDMLQHPRERVTWVEAALAAARRLKEREGETACLVNLGASLFILGEVERAAGCWQESLTLAREIGDRESEGFSINNLATIHLERGDFRTAVPLYQERLEIALQLGDQRGAASILNNLGHCWRGPGEVRRAIDHYEKALAVDRELGDRRGEGEVWATWPALTSI